MYSVHFYTHIMCDDISRYYANTSIIQKYSKHQTMFLKIPIKKNIYLYILKTTIPKFKSKNTQQLK